MPGRDTLRERARALFRAGGDVSLPRFARAGARPGALLPRKRSGETEQPVLYVREGVPAPTASSSIPRSSRRGDVRRRSTGGTPSRDGAFLAYGTSTNGTRAQHPPRTRRKTGADLPDASPTPATRRVAWVPDDKGFYYTRFPEPGSVPAGEEQEHRKLFFHRLGNDWHKDKLVFEPAAKEDSSAGRDLTRRALARGVRRDGVLEERGPRPRSLEGGRRAVGLRHHRRDGAGPTPIPREERLYLVTNDGAPNRRALHGRVRPPGPEAVARGHSREEGPLVGVDGPSRAQVVATYLHDASSRLERFTLGGKSLGALAAPRPSDRRA